MTQIFYKDEEVKFALGLNCPGFDPDRDAFDIIVATPNSSVTASKGNPAPDGSLLIFREPALSDSSSSSSDSSSSDDDPGTWFAIVDTQFLNIGDMRVIATVHVPDGNATGYSRKQIDVKPLGTLKKP